VRPLRLLLIALALSLVTAACGGDDEAPTTTTTTTTSSTSTTLPPSTTTSSSTTTTTVVAGPTSLLNGLPLDVDADLDRRVVAIKIDNHPDARPQSGVQDAEAVIEIIVEGGITRFITLFHGTDSDYVGPIRSGRPTDPGMIRPLGATFQISGAQPWVQSLINAAGVPFLTETQGSTFRIPAGNRAYERTLYGTTQGVRDVADARGFPDDPPPSSWFAFGAPSPSTVTAVGVTMSWDANLPEVRWQWDGERYLRSNGDTPHDWIDLEGNRGQIAADTLLVIKAAQYTACPSGSGSCVPAEETTGSGEALLFSEGTVVEGTWERESIADFFTLTTTDGAEMVVPAGHLWVSVFPNHRPLSWE